MGCISRIRIGRKGFELASEQDKELSEDATAAENDPELDANPAVVELDAPETEETDAFEDDAEARQEPIAPEKHEQVRRSSMWFPALAGAAATAVLAIAFVVYESRPGGMLARDAQVIDQLSASVQSLESQLAAADRAIVGLTEKLSGQTAAISDLAGKMSALDQEFAAASDVENGLSGLDARLTDIENRPIPEVGATKEAVEAYEAQLTAMRAMLAQELSRIEEQSRQSADWRNDAEALQRQAQLSDLADQLQSAINAGASFEGILQEIAGLGVDISPDLSGVATGVVSFSELRSGFPALARSAVEQDVRNKLANGEIGRLEGFLRLQLGARSTAPKAGDDVEAIVARAQDDLQKGDLDSAVKELAPLRAQASPDLTAWIQNAEVHLAAASAAAALATFESELNN